MVVAILGAYLRVLILRVTALHQEIVMCRWWRSSSVAYGCKRVHYRQQNSQSQGDVEHGNDAIPLVPFSLMRKCVSPSHVKARYGSNGIPEQSVSRCFKLANSAEIKSSKKRQKGV